MKAGFISLTKTGHSSISQMLPQINNFQNFNREWLWYGKHYCLKEAGHLKDYDFLFSSVRNPVERFVSSHEECKKNYAYGGNIIQFLEDYQTKQLTDIQMWHTQAQSFHLIPKDLDFIIKLESFEKDMKKLYDILELKTEFQPLWVNKNTKPKPQLPAFFKSQVEETFADCMNTFNY